MKLNQVSLSFPCLPLANLKFAWIKTHAGVSAK